jgi:hypothetical protein
MPADPELQKLAEHADKLRLAYVKALREYANVETAVTPLLVLLHTRSLWHADNAARLARELGHSGVELLVTTRFPEKAKDDIQLEKSIALAEEFVLAATSSMPEEDIRKIDFKAFVDDDMAEGFERQGRSVLANICRARPELALN